MLDGTTLGPIYRIYLVNGDRDLGVQEARRCCDAGECPGATTKVGYWAANGFSNKAAVSDPCGVLGPMQATETPHD